MRDANLAAFKAGHAFGETAELFDHPYEVRPAQLDARAPTRTSPATPRWRGAWSPPAQLAELPLFLGSYPITPASDILHELSKHKNFGVRTLQAEDEIAGIGAALGAAFGGHLGVTTTSGPGIALKGETMGLAVSLELPLLIIDIQRGGPSTGLPTKTEAADLLMAMYGRHGESPLPIVAAQQPEPLLRGRHRGGPHRAQVPHAGDPAVRRLPRQRLRAVAAARRRRRCPTSPSTFATEPNHTDADGNATFWPYLRDPDTLARPWARAGHARASMHRIGGIEKEDGSGNISYDPANHERMVRLRAAKIAGIADDIPPVEVAGDVDDAELLVARLGLDVGRHRRRRRAGCGRGAARSPTPTSPTSTRSRPNLGDVLRRYPTVLVPEMNLGQLSQLVRAEFLVDAQLDHQGPGHAVHRRRARAVASSTTSEAWSRDRPSIVPPPTTRKDWSSDQEVRWCPGCGDYSILAAVQMLMPELGVRRENTVFVSGIGCAARFPYYMNTYGMHRSTAGRRRSPPAWPWPGPTSTSGSSAATATRCRSAATT